MEIYAILRRIWIAFLVPPILLIGFLEWIFQPIYWILGVKTYYFFNKTNDYHNVLLEKDKRGKERKKALRKEKKALTR